MRIHIVLGLISLISPISAQIGLDIATQSKNFADSLVADLRDLDFKTAKVMDRIFNENNTCLKNIDEVIEAVQAMANLVVEASPDLESLNNEVEALVEMSGEVEVVNQVAVILRSLSPLLSKLSPNLPINQLCSTSPEIMESYFRSLALILQEISYEPQLANTLEVQDKLYRSGNIVSTVSAFLSQLKTLSLVFGNSCFTDKESIVLGMQALGRMIDRLGDMFSTLGNSRVGQEIRGGKQITKKVLAQILQMKDVDFGNPDCSNADLNSAADTMEDFAKLIKELGAEKIKDYLGIDFGLGQILETEQDSSQIPVLPVVSIVKTEQPSRFGNNRPDLNINEKTIKNLNIEQNRPILNIEEIIPNSDSEETEQKFNIGQNRPIAIIRPTTIRPFSNIETLRVFSNIEQTRPEPAFTPFSNTVQIRPKPTFRPFSNIVQIRPNPTNVGNFRQNTNIGKPRQVIRIRKPEQDSLFDKAQQFVSSGLRNLIG